MDSSDSVTTAMWLMVLIQTIGSVDPPGTGERKLPAPRAYVAIVVAYGILSMVADLPAQGARRAAGAAAWIMVLAAAVVGPFGSTVISFINGVANKFAVSPGATTSAATVPYPTPEATQ
jgi:hypothetical protein